MQRYDIAATLYQVVCPLEVLFVVVFVIGRRAHRAVCVFSLTVGPLLLSGIFADEYCKKKMMWRPASAVWALAGRHINFFLLYSGDCVAAWLCGCVERVGPSQGARNGETTSMKRHKVASTLMRRCINVMRPLGSPFAEGEVF